MTPLKTGDRFGIIKRLRPRPSALERERWDKLPNCTSRFCPQCYSRDGEFIKRRRDYQLTGPKNRAECDPSLPQLSPRRSYRGFPWNVPLIHWLMAPPDPSTDGDWFESIVNARCPYHGRHQVHELCGIRKFSRIRLWTFWIRTHIIAKAGHSKALDWIIPPH